MDIASVLIFFWLRPWSVNFTMLYLKWFVLHFTVGVTRLLLGTLRSNDETATRTSLKK